jgi:putative acetyltransferase
MVEIVEYQPRYKQDFKSINVEWISASFVVEPHDLEQLDAPEVIINTGGQIFLALLKGEVVGTSALINEGNGVYELAKMGVTPKAKGLGIGKALCIKTIALAKENQAKVLYLLSNRKATTALNMYLKLGFEEVSLGPTLYARADIKMNYPL